MDIDVCAANVHLLIHYMPRNSFLKIAIRDKTLGFLLRRRRLALGLTQKELAVLASARQSAISRLEKCERVPHPATLERIHRALKDTR